MKKKISSVKDILDKKFKDTEYGNCLIKATIKFHNPHPVANKAHSRYNLNNGSTTVIFNLKTTQDYRKAISNYFEDFCGDRGELYSEISVDDISIETISWLDIKTEGDNEDE